MNLKEILEGIPQLTERERRVLSLRYDEHGNTIMTLANIGREIGVSRERIRVNEMKALHKLRHPLIRRDHQELAGFISARVMK